MNLIFPFVVEAIVNPLAVLSLFAPITKSSALELNPVSLALINSREELTVMLDSASKVFAVSEPVISLSFALLLIVANAPCAPVDPVAP